MVGDVDQRAEARAGFAYGIVGADVHRRGDGSPVYVLLGGVDRRDPDPRWLRELPSRMLNSVFSVVDFVGRARELEELHDWRLQGPRLRARLIHAAGGQGKSRLAAHFAEQAGAAGWQVVTAVSGTGAVLPASSVRDLRSEHAGLLVVVDYADRWPPGEIAMLLGNALLHRDQRPVRIVLLARSTVTWPSLLVELERVGAEASERELAALPVVGSERVEMFAVARRCFSRVYGVRDPSSIGPPPALDDDVVGGLTLGVHIAALVAVDAAVTGRPIPTDPAGLTVYLLDREHRHWALLHEQGRAISSPSSMNRAVCAAALVGRVPRQDGVSYAPLLVPGDDPSVLLDDHARCYPVSDTDNAVLEPLYPDRLAEDFLALTLPGHQSDYPAQPWAVPVLDAVLAASPIAGASRARAITFLAAGAARWPHLRSQHLYPRILADPQAVLDAGNLALATVASIPEVTVEVLEALERAFPPGRHLDLDAGMAQVMLVLTERRVASFTDPVMLAEAHKRCGFRLSHANRFKEALEHDDRALSLLRAAEPLSADATFLLGVVLMNLGNSLHNVGRRDDALTVTQEAVVLHRRLAESGDDSAAADLAEVLGNLSVCLSRTGRRAEAIDRAAESVEILRRLDEQDCAYRATLARVELNLSHSLSEVGRWDEALTLALTSNLRWRELAESSPGAHRLNYAEALRDVGVRFSDLQQHEEALPFIDKGLSIIREYADAELVHQGRLSSTLDALSRCLHGLGRLDEAITAARESLHIDRRLAETDPVTFGPDVSRSLDELGLRLAAAERLSEALAASAECVAIRRSLALDKPETYLPELSAALHNHAMYQSEFGDLEGAVATCREVVGVRRALIDDAPDGRNDYLQPDLAIALNNQAHGLKQIVRRDYPWRPLGFSKDLGQRGTSLLREAIALVDEAIDLYGRVIDRHPMLADHLKESIEMRDGMRRRLGL